MGTKEYVGANCTLFRTPPVDVSIVGSDIENMIVDAWKSGRSASDTLLTLLDNKEVLSELSSQVSSSLLFQRRTELDEIKDEVDTRKQKYQQNYETKIKEIDQTVGIDTQEKQKLLILAQQELKRKEQEYDASLAGLDDMRQRVREKLKNIGGEKGFEDLLRIHDYISGPVDSGVSDISREPIYSRTYSDENLKKALDIVKGKDDVDPLKRRSLEHRLDDSVTRKKSGGVYGFFRNLWGRLFYRK